MLAEGTNITIYAGSGCVNAHDEVVELAQRLKAPVAHTSRGKDQIEYDNPNNVGMTGVIGMESGYHAILNCDTLLLLGTDFAWRQFYPDHAKIIQVDIDSTHVGRRHPVDLGVVGNIKDTLQALLPRVAQRENATFLNSYVERHKKALKAQAERATPGHRGKIPGQYLTSIINRLANKDALFTADDGTPLCWMLRMVEANGKRRMFGSLLHGTMASSIGNAIGLQKAQPGRQVIALAGDGGFTMLLGDAITTIQEKLPIKIAVYDNGKLGFVELEQKGEGLLPVYTDLLNPDFGKVAQAMGLWGRTVSKADELEGAVAEWLGQPWSGAAQCQGRADGTRDAAAHIGRERLWDGNVFSQGRHAWTGGRCFRNDRAITLPEREGQSGAPVNSILICRDCDTVYRAIPLRRGDVALCRRCDAVLARYFGVKVESGLALVCAAAIFFAIANLTPTLSIDVAGVETEANIWLAVRSLQRGWISVAAFGLAFTTFLIPGVQIALLFWLLLFARLGRRPPGFGAIMKLLHRIRPWSMTEVFLLGALVAIVKLANWVPITAGAGIWAIAALTVVLALLGRCDPASWWSIAPGGKL